MAKKYKIYIEGDFDEALLDFVCDQAEGASFFYGDKYLRFNDKYGAIETFKTLIESFGFKISCIK